MVGADEQRGVQPVAPSLDEPAEEELLAGGSVGHERVVRIAVDLRGDDEPDIRVTEVPEGALEKEVERDVVGIELGNDVILVLVLGSPRVVVAALGLGPVRPGVGVVLGATLTSEVPHAQLGSSGLDIRVVPLVEDPHIEEAVMLDLLHLRQGRGDDLERLLARNDRREEGDPKPGGRVDGHGILGVQTEDADRQALPDSDKFDEDDEAKPTWATRTSQKAVCSPWAGTCAGRSTQVMKAAETATLSRTSAMRVRCRRRPPTRRKAT